MGIACSPITGLYSSGDIVGDGGGGTHRDVDGIGGGGGINEGKVGWMVVVHNPVSKDSY